MLPLLLCALALLAATRGLVRHNTWYLASDQFAFLTFADDLLRGSVFHDPSTIELLAGPRLPREWAVDTYYQTYVFRDGRLYSRYPPGFPLLLAGAKALGGETAEHWLNPLLYLTLMVVLARLAARLAVAPAATAATTIWALLVVPVEVHYWGITVARDLPAHLLALAGILAAISGACGRAGLALGLAASIRPDAALWGVSIAAVLPPSARRLRPRIAGAVGFVVGALPLFAYNALTQGHPLAFTQGSEFRGVFQSGLEIPWPTFDAPSYVSGGGFRLAHFPSTFPAHVRYLAGSFGAFLWVALGTLLATAVRRRPLARALGPYAVIALLFYSCWSHGDARYLVGVSLCLIVLASSGLVAIARGLADPATSARVRVAVLVLVVGGLLVAPRCIGRDPARGLTALERTAAVALAAAAALPLVPGAAAAAPLLPALAFVAFGATRMVASGGARDGFQADQIERARRTIEAVIPKGALVLTSAGLGRPAENITHYTHAEAHYVGELFRLQSDANVVAYRCTLRARPFYLLLRPDEPLPFRLPAEWQIVREITRLGGDSLRDWFIDPRRATLGAVLYEAEIRPTLPLR